MARFKAGEVDVLVATTVIEVGVDVPNATVMIVQEADRFGLAQLHQLRGRVGRGAEQSFCLLVSRAKEELTENARQRLDALVATGDGFELAEVDLELRRHGELLGVRQSGASDLRFADFRHDRAAARARAAGGARRHRRRPSGRRGGRALRGRRRRLARLELREARRCANRRAERSPQREREAERGEERDRRPLRDVREQQAGGE